MTTRIGILDAMGGGNLGDAAIQDSVISNIRRRLPAAGIVGFSFAPEDTRKRHNITSYPLTRDSRDIAYKTKQSFIRRDSRTKLKTWIKKMPPLYVPARVLANGVREFMFLVSSYKKLKNIDLLVISGGGQICELWGGPWAHLYNLFKFSILAKLAGTRLYYLDVGAEPLEHWLSRFFAKISIEMADYVSFRDAYSQTQMQGMRVKAKMHVHADPVYGLEMAFYLKGNNSNKPSMPTVGINPLGYCDPRVWPRKEQEVYDAYLTKLTKFSLWLVEQGYFIKLFTTSSGVDKYAVSDLKRQLTNSSASGGMNHMPDDSGDGVHEVNCNSVREVVVEMSMCDFIVTSRYHGVIFSHLLHKPVIVLNYQGKSDVAMKAAGLGQYSADIERFAPEWLIDSFRSLVRNREIISSREATAVNVCTEKLRKQFDELFSPAT